MHTVLRRTAKTAWRAAAGVTGWARTLPDFLIIGTQKGGTTSLFNYLVRHPQVLRPTMKEVHFFDQQFERGTAWYRTHFPLAAVRATLRKSRGQALTGESSPCYLAHPLAPERVAAVVPSARLIVLLRDPVERAYSHFRMRVRQGREVRENFADALRAESDDLRATSRRLADAPDPETRRALEMKRYQSLLHRGRYAEQVRRWQRYFPREQFLFLKSEDFFRDEAAGLKRALEFLELDPWLPESFDRYNDSGASAPIEPSLRSRLNEYFARHNTLLPQLVGDDFRWDNAEAGRPSPMQHS